MIPYLPIYNGIFFLICDYLSGSGRFWSKVGTSVESRRGAVRGSPFWSKPWTVAFFLAFIMINHHETWIMWSIMMIYSHEWWSNIEHSLNTSNHNFQSVKSISIIINHHKTWSNWPFFTITNHHQPSSFCLGKKEWFVNRCFVLARMRRLTSPPTWHHQFGTQKGLCERTDSCLSTPILQPLWTLCNILLSIIDHYRCCYYYDR